VTSTAVGYSGGVGIFFFLIPFQPPYTNLHEFFVLYFGIHYAEDNPTYRRIKDHTECLLIRFDPTIVSYQVFSCICVIRKTVFVKCLSHTQELVDHFMQDHDAWSGSRKGQYRSLLAYLTPEQEVVCKASLERKASYRPGQKVPSTVPFVLCVVPDCQLILWIFVFVIFIDSVQFYTCARQVTTSVEPATHFYLAEEYHQNYINKQRDM
jgi:peptide methionine sulfoxide reductase MsrA